MEQGGALWVRGVRHHHRPLKTLCDWLCRWVSERIDHDRSGVSDI
jgi:hypothetical protein